MRPAENPRAALTVLRSAVDALKRVGVTAWLTDGTLLGAVRERAFIPHDLDMDLGAMITEYHAGVVTALEHAGFRVKPPRGSVESGLQHKLSRDGFKLDIFWHYDTPQGGVWHGATDKRGTYRYSYGKLVLAPLDFMRESFWAPSPPRLHLAAKYGLAWRTPVEEWDWALSPANAEAPE